MTDNISIQPLTTTDRNWMTAFLRLHWGATTMIARGLAYEVDTLPGFLANEHEEKDERVGLVTYRIEGSECEIMSLNSTRPGKGVGTKLIEAVKHVARESSCTHLKLITTNDNLNALGFYQKRGFVLAALYPNAIAQSRKLKPQIPLIGDNGIPLRDEIELELDLTTDQT